MKHTDLTQYFADNTYDTGAVLECYFDDYTMSLWFVYVNGAEIINVMSDTTIKALEREYAAFVRKEAREHNLDLAIARSESLEA